MKNGKVSHVFFLFSYPLLKFEEIPLSSYMVSVYSSALIPLVHHLMLLVSSPNFSFVFGVTFWFPFHENDIINARMNCSYPYSLQDKSSISGLHRVGFLVENKNVL